MRDWATFFVVVIVCGALRIWQRKGTDLIPLDRSNLLKAAFALGFGWFFSYVSDGHINGLTQSFLTLMVFWGDINEGPDMDYENERRNNQASAE